CCSHRRRGASSAATEIASTMRKALRMIARMARNKRAPSRYATTSVGMIGRRRCLTRAGLETVRAMVVATAVKIDVVGACECGCLREAHRYRERDGPDDGLSATGRIRFISRRSGPLVSG